MLFKYNIFSHYYKRNGDLFMFNEKKEIETIELMIKIYCRHHHKNKGLCQNCQNILNYSSQRIELCPVKSTKTFCSCCKIHCYNKEIQKEIKKIMRYSGPFMLFYHPIKALSHMFLTIKYKH